MISAVGRHVGIAIKALVQRYGAVDTASGTSADSLPLPLAADRSLTVICAGSVWNSYDLFRDALLPHMDEAKAM